MTELIDKEYKVNLQFDELPVAKRNEIISGSTHYYYYEIGFSVGFSNEDDYYWCNDILFKI